MKLTGQRNQCAACEAYFNSNSAFDEHRTGPFGSPGAPSARRCLSGEEMSAKGMARNAAGFWCLPCSDADRARLMALRRRG